VPIDAAHRSGLLLRPFLPLGAGAFVAQASSLATYHADKLLVSALISPAAAGAYAICTSIANKILLVVAAGATFTFPRSARLHTEGDTSGIATTYARATRLSLLLAALMAVTLITIAPAFLGNWLGAKFASEYGLTLRLLALGYAIAASSVVASNVAVGIGEVFTPAVFAVLGGTITLSALVLLAPQYGASGAAGAALIGMTQALVFNDMLAKRLGPAAREASWPLIWRMALIGVPVAIIGGTAATFVDGWISLVLLGSATAGMLTLFWLWTFGRVTERALVDRLILRIRHA
jgi:O-antigen/teichoic acid export membrane protein